MSVFEGVHVALATPFYDDGAIDYASLQALASSLVERGVQGLVPCGTTGESATLSHDEHIDVIAAVVEAVEGRVPVIAGTGSNNTQEAVRLTARAEKVGADAALLIAPYYNKPSQEGLYQHFHAIAEAGELPLILYNIPGRTAVNVTPDTVARLAAHPNIAGVKEATGSIANLTELKRRVPDDFVILAGDDGFFLPLLALGGHGVISVVAHLAPERIVELWKAWLAGDPETARQRHMQLAPLIDACFVETNPAPVKEALYLTGAIPSAHLRLPMVRVAKQGKVAIRRGLAEAGLEAVRGW